MINHSTPGMHRNLDATGTIRRLRALVAIGYTPTDLAQSLDMHVSSLSTLIHGKRPRIQPQTQAAVRALFSELWAHPIQGHAGERARKRAKKHNWVGPLAWDDIDDPAEVANVIGPAPRMPHIEHQCTVTVLFATGAPTQVDILLVSQLSEPEPIDEVAVELAMTGREVTLTTAERQEAVIRLHRLRWSDKRIAAALRVADRTVLRDRQDLGLEAFKYSEIRQVDAA
jgi:hypothetical protein